MTNFKNTKRALFSSAIALVLCFSMLLGTTFAWFTDSVTSSGNVIQTGTLKIKMDWAEGKENPSTATWNDASTGTIFKNDKWEPGYTEAKHIKVSNIGTLSLKYKLVIDPNGEVTKLADVIDVYYIATATQVTRESIASATPVGTLRQMIEDPDGAAYGFLAASESKTVTIALKMREDAGNEYQNMSIGTDFTLKLVATQYTIEGDSFNNQYDDNLEYPNVGTLVLNENSTVETAIKAGDTTVKMPAGMDAGKYEFTISNENEEKDENNNTVLSFDLELTKDGAKVTDEGLVYTVEKYVGKNLNMGKVTHNGEEVTNAMYDSTTGILTFTVNSFSPFTVSYYSAIIETVEDLANVAKGGNFVLSADLATTESITVPAGVTAIFDLNGHEINGGYNPTNAERHIYVFDVYGELVVNDSVGTGSANGRGTYVRVDAKLTLNGGTLSGIDSNGGSAIYQYGGDVVINGGTVKQDVEKTLNYAIYAGGGTVTVNGGTLVGTHGAMFVNGADATINAGTLLCTGNVGWTDNVVYVDNGSVNVKGGIILHEGQKVNADSGAALVATDNAKSVTISGGEFTGLNGAMSSAAATTTITGGIFANGAYVNNHYDQVTTYIAEGYYGKELDGKIYVLPTGTDIVTNDEELVAAINAAEDGEVILLATGSYSLRFTNNTAFNVDNLTIKGMNGVTLSISSSEVWYGRIQGNNATFENINFVSNVGATGKATYNNCKFDGWTICASSGNNETYFNNCEIAILNNSVDFSSGDTYINNCTVAKAEYSGAASMNFEDCTIGELICWNMDTTLTNCIVEKLDLSNVTDAEIIIDGLKWIADGLFKATDANVYYVDNANGFEALNKKMLDKTAGQNAVVNLRADIDYTGKTWTPVDSHADTAFFLTEFNGNGYTIYNLTINGQAMFTRFAGFGDVTVKNVTFDNATVNSVGINAAIITAQTYQNLLLDNVDVKNSYITGSYKVAALVGTVYNESDTTVTATLKNCDVTDTVVKSTTYDFCTTGLVAFVYAGNNDKIVFENCTVTNVKIIAPNDGYKAHAWVYTTGSDDLYDEAEGVTVTDCTFENL